MNSLLDTDHSSLLIDASGPDYAVLSLRIAEILESEIYPSVNSAIGPSSSQWPT